MKSVAGVDAALQAALLKSARSLRPLSVTAGLRFKVAEVAPLIFVKVTPPSVETSHRTVGVGVPPAAAVNDTDVPAVVMTLAGLLVTVGGIFTITVRVAPLVVAVPATFVKTARY
jgi:hypothetical protein